MSHIKPLYLTLEQLLTDRLFQIADFQRPYSWETRQRQDLFEDIERVSGLRSDQHHFMATIVARRAKTKKLAGRDYHVLELVDGQQRMTTLVILLKAIEKQLKKSDKAMAARLEAVLNKGNSEYALLQTNHSTTLIFREYLRKGEYPTVRDVRTTADIQLVSAIKECEDFVGTRFRREGTVENLLNTVKKRLGFVLYEISDEETAYTLFEVLNSRGLDVSWPDRLKSLLMGRAFKFGSQADIDHLQQVWKEIYGVVGTREYIITEALRFAGTLYLNERPSKLLSEPEAVGKFRERATSSDKILDAAAALLNMVKACERLHSNQRLCAVGKVVHTRFLATAIDLHPDLAEREKEDLQRLWENVTFRIYGLAGKDARSSVGDYVRLAWEVGRKKIRTRTIAAQMKEWVRFYPKTELLKVAKKQDRYNDWQDELLYFMQRYEEFLARRQGQKFDNEVWKRIWAENSAKSIEHIWPQRNADRLKNREDIHRLGNLILLPPRLNSSLRASNPATKGQHYIKTGLLHVQQVVDDLAGWNSASIEKRERELLRWAADEWSDKLSAQASSSGTRSAAGRVRKPVVSSMRARVATKARPRRT
ncbi:DUF262 domain-containing protein [Microvirga splendida]|uniref:DUF262 domain-containing protein n=1 Tax=Microvirga splendida TaxID=2795727 RepID=A0ABS0Y652_9HYPH|nr:DUF262 domain-containing protein [Microvirga splendida]MBJ6127385.1 DUF262 domain-containing protein [Microvirga splendida]